MQRKCIRIFKLSIKGALWKLCRLLVYVSDFISKPMFATVAVGST